MTKKTFYVGVATTYHDPAIAIVDQDGEVLFAEATERYTQNKRAIGCLAETGYRMKELVDKYCTPDAHFVIADSWSRAYRNIAASLRFVGFSSPAKIMAPPPDRLSYSWLNEFETHYMFNMQYATLKQFGLGMMVQLKRHFPAATAEFRHHDHHSTHAAMASYSSAYDDAACLVIDGFGELGAVSVFHYQKQRLRRIKQYVDPASLGFFYMMMTGLCGFNHEKGEEWKVMGLAPYGKLNPELYALLKSMFRVKDYNLKYASRRTMVAGYQTLRTYARKKGEDPLKAADLAFTAQGLYAEWLTEIIGNLAKLKLSPNLTIGGGCALNSAYMGKVTGQTSFKNVHIPSAPADDGNALGAAWLSCIEDGNYRRASRAVLSPYLGSEISPLTLKNMLEFSGLKVKHLPNSVHAETAKLLAEGQLVGWMQHRAEWGPRALGNRSILADPRPPGMKDKINARVKFREEFRPFAPSILDEHGSEYFLDYQFSPYMERTLLFRKEVQAKVPAVVHDDETGRVQSVTKTLNPSYHRLISAFKELTGVPILLNTSFNVMGKPIIHSIEDALATFFTCGLDVLVIGDYLVQK